MNISFAFADFIKYALPEIVMIIWVTLGTIGLIFIGYKVIKSQKKSKEILMQSLKDDYVIFTNEQWESYQERAVQKTVSNLVESFDFYPKDFDMRKKLCGVWCNPDDTTRYYITDHCGYFVLMAEDRYTKDCKNFLIRQTFGTSDQNVFFADGNGTITLGYNQDEDRIYIPDYDEELERIESYMENMKPEMNDDSFYEIQLSDVEFEEPTPDEFKID